MSYISQVYSLRLDLLAVSVVSEAARIECLLFLHITNTVRISYRIYHKSKLHVHRFGEVGVCIKAKRTRKVKEIKPHGNRSAVSTNNIRRQQPSTNNLLPYYYDGQRTQHDILRLLGSESCRFASTAKALPPNALNTFSIPVPHHRQAPCLPTSARQTHPPMMMLHFLGYSNISLHTLAPTRFPYAQCILSIRHRKPSNTDANRCSRALPRYHQVRLARTALRHRLLSHQSTSKTNSPPKALPTTSKAA